MANKHRPWWCDVFEQQRIALGYDAEETATHANGALDDDRMIDAEGYAAIERGDVQPDIDVFEAIAGALWLGVKVDAQLELRLELTTDPTADAEYTEWVFTQVSPAFSPAQLTVGEREVRSWCEQHRA